MKLNDRISKMPPWNMGRISREIYDALRALGLKDKAVDRIHYDLMGKRLKDAAEYIDVRPYLG